MCSSLDYGSFYVLVSKVSIVIDYSKIEVSTPVHQAVSVAVSPAPVNPAAPSTGSLPETEMLKVHLM